MATLQDFENILMQTLSPDNAIRKHAEELFEQAKQIPDQIITYLTQLLRQSERPDVWCRCFSLLSYVGPCIMCSDVASVACNKY